MARMLSSAAAPVRRPASYEHIFAYCNVSTKQVLYSLTAKLQPAHLKQLPDLGANNTPPSLRKDMWRPLWRVKFPTSPHTKQQVLHAFKKLREWRKLHELCWERPKELSIPFTKERIERMQDKLNMRGGSKKESVYDLVKRQKRKMRLRVIMDQKANSIADLAAVLQAQKDLGKATPVNRAPHSLKLTDVTEMVNLANEYAPRDPESTNIGQEATKLGQDATNLVQENKKLQRLKSQIEESRKQLAELRQQPESSDYKVKKRTQKSIKTHSKSLKASALLLRKIEWSLEAVAKARQKAARDGKEDSLEVLATYLPQVFPETHPALRMELASTQRNLENAPRRGWVAAEIKRRLQPVFGTEGVRISWSNKLDREFAASWPLGVSHHQLGAIWDHRFAQVAPSPTLSGSESLSMQPQFKFSDPAQTATAISSLSLESVRERAIKEKWVDKTKGEYWKPKVKAVGLDRTPSSFARGFRDKFQRQRTQIAANLSQ